MYAFKNEKAISCRTTKKAAFHSPHRRSIFGRPVETYGPYPRDYMSLI